MKINIDNLKKEEQISLKIEALYESYGYRKFKMRSFEEYSMYYSYGDFLPSKNVITFAGSDGKLLALRPDVTLSIIKNTKATKVCTEKLFYNEKVYRWNGKDKEFKEISQIGVELIGNVDTYAYAEITSLALKSLESIDENFVLDISDMAVVNSVINFISKEHFDEIYELLRSKNFDDFLVLAENFGFSKDRVEAFKTLCSLSSGVRGEISELENLKLDEATTIAVENFKKVLKVLSENSKGEKINVNFSIMGNADYYNGLIFNGYISGVPKAVLSGGRYDGLLEKFGKDAEAIGFAIYLGEIERYLESNVPTSDVLVVYEKDSDVSELIKAVEKLLSSGVSVRVDTSIPQNFAYKKLMKFSKGKLVEVQK